jgi:hypothetical protein
MTIDRIRNDAKSAQGTKGAASYKVISDAKDLTDAFKDSRTGNIDFNAIYSRGKFAENVGAHGIIKENEKLNPTYLRNNDYELQEKGKQMLASGIIPAGIANPHTDPRYRPQIQDAVEADGFKKASVPELKSYHKSVMQNPAFLPNVRAQILSRAAITELNEEQAVAIKGQIPNIQTQITTLLGVPANASEAQRRKARKGLTPSVIAQVDDLTEKIKIIKNNI